MLIGGAGSGKSTVLHYLKEHYGARTIQTDCIAHELYEPGKKGYAAAVKILGEKIIKKDGTLDRELMADILFGNPESLKRLDDVLHPMVWNEVEKKIASEGKGRFVAVETALLPKRKSDLLNEVWYVCTSKDGRIRRLQTERGYSLERTLAVFREQPSDGEYQKMADRVLMNEDSPEKLEEQIDLLLSGKAEKEK